MHLALLNAPQEIPFAQNAPICLPLSLRFQNACLNCILNSRAGFFNAPQRTDAQDDFIYVDRTLNIHYLLNG